MKIKAFIFSLLAIVGVLSCITDHPSPQVLNVSENTLRFSGRGGVWKLYVTSNSDWQVSGSTDWCNTDKITGQNTDEILITVDSNETKVPRSTQLYLQGDRHQATISIQQDTATGEYHYELPVVFHVLYSESQDTSTKSIKPEQILKLVDKCNQKYSDHTNSIDMNLELVVATEDPNGNPLQQAGLNFIKANSINISCDNFMSETNKTYAEYLWNPNKYINVFVYNFKESNVLGIAHLPYTPRENSLEGLEENNHYFSNMPAYAHCISINRKYIHEEDAYITLAHELGHYLGLYHVFSEKECEGTDYCGDTPNYDRSKYEASLKEMENPATNPQALLRTSCDSEGQTFTSYNIMDYFYGYQNQFTLDQYKRIRHVLENSPLIPGPKNISTTKSYTEDVIPEVRSIK